MKKTSSMTPNFGKYGRVDKWMIWVKDELNWERSTVHREKVDANYSNGEKDDDIEHKYGIWNEPQAQNQVVEV